MKRILSIIILLLLMTAMTAFATQDPENLSAVTRHGTLVVRIPDERIDYENNFGGNFGFEYTDRIYTCTDTKEIERIARALLYGDTQDTFLNDLRTDGNSSAIEVSYAYAYPNNEIGVKTVCVMNTRHMDDAWYSIVRLSENTKGELELGFFIRNYRLELKDGVLFIEYTSSYDLDFYYNVGDADNNNAYHSDGTVALYNTLGRHLMVYTPEHDANLCSKSVDPYIGGERVPLWTYLTGYTDSGKKDVYCLLLTDEEAEAVKRDSGNGIYPELKPHEGTVKID